ncbi:MAG TPA: serine hydrolase [Gemmatimonadaceae bacterium]|nr:serine hydrolase [Gemmatimonadaceae bacterium]
MLFQRVTIAGIMIVAFAHSAAAQPATDARAARVDSLFARLRNPGSPGLAVAVVRDGKILLLRAYGMAILESQTPLTPRTVFETASLSKQITGFAIATLAAEGRIKLGDDIRKYIPELADFGKPITIDNLVHHTSGLRDWYHTLSVGGWRSDDPISFMQILTMAFNQRTLNFTPGAEYEYSNTGYNVLAELVQRVTGQSLAAWTEEHLFRPLGMNDTHIRMDRNEVIPNRAFGYGQGSNNTFRAIDDNLVAPGSSSVFSTVEDFARWLANLGTAQVGGPSAIAMMMTPTRLNHGTVNRYGFGITVSDKGGYKGLPFVTSSGYWAGFDTFDAWFPRQKFGVVVFANSDALPIDAQSAVIAISDIYLAADFPPAGSEPASSDDHAATPPRLEPDKYVGRYRFANGQYLRIQRQGEGLVVQLAGHGFSRLSMTSETEFAVDGEDDTEPLVFERSSAREITGLAYRGRHATKLGDSQLAPRPLADYVGDYDSDELGTSYHVAVEKGALQLQHRHRGIIALSWLWLDEFGSDDPFFTSVRFERDSAGRVAGFVVNASPRARDLRFRRRYTSDVSRRSDLSMRLPAPHLPVGPAYLATRSMAASTQLPGGDAARQIDTFLTRASSLDQLTGVALVADKGRIVYEKAFGLANREWSVPNTVESRFEIASMTKPMTAIAVMQLVQESKVRLDGHVSDYLPFYPKETGDRITVDQLLNHTSGLQQDIAFADDAGGAALAALVNSDALSNDSLVKLIAQRPLRFQPGSDFGYSSDAYAVLGAIVEHVTGVPYWQALKDRVLARAGMSETGVAFANAVVPKRAYGYAQTFGGYELAPHIGVSPAGGLYSTIRDLFRFDRALYDEALVGQSSKARLFAVRSVATAYGWKTSEEVRPNGVRRLILRTTGGLPGFQALMVRVPSEDRAIIFLSNSRELVWRFDDFAVAINHILDGESYSAPRSSVAEVLAELLRGTERGQALRDRFAQMRADTANYSLDEAEMNRLGYYVLNNLKAPRDAVQIFEMNVAAFPRSANPYDSLGEAYLATGDTAQAIANYRKSLSLNPQNSNATAALKRLRAIRA